MPRLARIGDDDWQRLLERAPLLDRLDPSARSRLRALCESFLVRKSFSAAGGIELDDLQCLAVAAQACLPVMNLGIESLDGWREVIVYPGEFRVRGEQHDPDTGVVTEYDEALIGEAWDRGPLVLSWADIAEDLAHPFEGFNVVIHEIAHKLDTLDGAMNGMPRLPAAIGSAEWIGAMSAARCGLERQLRTRAATPIDPYAAESAEEFFAVTSEIHFSAPALLRLHMPDVASLLARYYGGDSAGSAPPIPTPAFPLST